MGGIIKEYHDVIAGKVRFLFDYDATCVTEYSWLVIEIGDEQVAFGHEELDMFLEDMADCHEKQVAAYEDWCEPDDQVKIGRIYTEDEEDKDVHRDKETFSKEQILEILNEQWQEDAIDGNYQDLIRAFGIKKGDEE